MRIRMAGATDIGLKRKSNQDSIFYDEPHGLGLVADGIGGRRGGEVASSIAVNSLKKLFLDTDLVRYGEINSFLASTIDRINQDILARGQLEPEIAGMGTTLNCLLFVGNKLHLAHIGDSRTYLFQDEQFYQLTLDHNVQCFAERGWLKPGQYSPSAKPEALIRAVGLGPAVEVDVYEVDLVPGQVFLTCSDGLSGMVSDIGIADIMKKYRNRIDDLPKRLIEAANAGGGRDNITVLISEVRGK
ncbi:MAG: protein phosphatase 2C domain-containing protein [Proteobacteria bacterium]|nr:protein phosphatase 2C domain-containing protein [Pseudomonadota bacterium]